MEKDEEEKDLIHLKALLTINKKLELLKVYGLEVLQAGLV